jgi:hypothetical protein
MPHSSGSSAPWDADAGSLAGSHERFERLGSGQHGRVAALADPGGMARVGEFRRGTANQMAGLTVLALPNH